MPGAELAGRCVAVVSASPIVRASAVRQIEASGGKALAFATIAEAAAQAPKGAVLLIDPADGASARRTGPAPKDRDCLVMLTPEARGRIARYRAAGYAGYLIKPLLRRRPGPRARGHAGRGGRTRRPRGRLRGAGAAGRGQPGQRPARQGALGP
jgi:hypothetical protein